MRLLDDPLVSGCGSEGRRSQLPFTIVPEQIMPTQELNADSNSATTRTRPLYIRRVPESVWDLVHINAIKSRMRLQTYLVRIMQESEPLRTEDVSQDGEGPTASSPTSDEV